MIDSIWEPLVWIYEISDLAHKGRRCVLMLEAGVEPPSHLYVGSAIYHLIGT
jgi:hypothetical protein